MIKKYPLIFILFVVSLVSHAQFNVYHPFPDSNAYWGEENKVFPGTGNVLDINEFGYKLYGDTVINGLIYHKLYQVGGFSGTSQGGGTLYHSMGYYGAIREDTMRHIYFLSSSAGNKDSLLYDFNLKVGDTLRQYNSPGLFSNGNSNEANYVYQIDSVLIEGSIRRQFVIASNFGNNQIYQVADIIEGIGSTTGLVEPIDLPFEYSSALICFRQNGYTVISGSSYFAQDTCIVYGPLGVNNITNAPPMFIIYPNPANTSVELTFQLQNKNSVLSLYNTMGQLVKTQTINGNEKSITEDVSALPNGIYYYTLSVEGVVQATNKLAIIR